MMLLAEGYMTENQQEVSFTVKELFIEIRHDVQALGDRIATIERSGTDQARNAAEQVNQLRLDMEIIKREMASHRAVEEAINKLENSQRRITIAHWGVGISFLAAMCDLLLIFFRR